jgi:hypothetical protein
MPLHRDEIEMTDEKKMKFGQWKYLMVVQIDMNIQPYGTLVY